MGLLRGGWSRFRLLPPVVQALIGVVLISAYSIALVALVGGGGGEAAKKKPRKLTAQEQRLAKAVGDAGVRQLEITDVNDFRRARIRDVRCTAGSCAVTYAVGVPGGGRLRVQQSDMLQTIYKERGVRRVTLTAYRDMVVGRNRPLKAEEETGAGALLLETKCDADKRPEIDWSKKPGGAIIEAICVSEAGDAPGRPQTAGPPEGRGNAGAGEGE